MKYLIRWKDNSTEILEGSDIASCFIAKGYANNATINKLAYYQETINPLTIAPSLTEDLIIVSEVYTDESLMNYGKYNGYKMANIPDSYLRWIYENNKCTPPVKAYIENNADSIGINIKTINH